MAANGEEGTNQNSFPVVKENGDLAGIVSVRDLYNFNGNSTDTLDTLIENQPLTIFSDNIIRIAVDIMTYHNYDIIPVVKREEPKKL